MLPRLFLILLVLQSIPLHAGEKPTPPPPPKGEEELPELPRAKMDDAIFVKTGTVQIAFQDVEKIVNLFMINERKKNPKYVPSFDTLLKSRLQIAEILMRNALLEKYAKDNKLAATKEEVDQYIDLHKKLLAGRGMTHEQFLADTGMTDEEYRRHQTAKIPVERQASSAITDKEVEDKFNELKDESPLRSAAHILFQFKGADSAPKALTRSKEDARSIAEQALAQAKAGKDFAELAKSSDDEATRANGGAVDYFPLKGAGAMVEAFGNATYAIPKPGDYSPVVESPYGFHVIKLTGLRNDELKKQIRAYLASQKYKSLVEPFMEAALKDSVFNEKHTTPPKN